MTRKFWVRVLSLFVFTLFLCSNFAFADKTPAYENQDEYIFSLKEDTYISMDSSADIEPVAEKWKIYSTSDKALLDELIAEGVIETYGHNIPVTLYSTPNDPLFNIYQWTFTQTRANYALDNLLFGQGIKVAVIDSGIYREHPDLANANIETGGNYVDTASGDDPNVYDEINHGTAVTGIIAAQYNNNIGIVGLAHKVTIYPLKVFSAQTGSLLDTIQAMYHAVELYHCDVINMSLGANGTTDVFTQVVERAEEQGIIVVAAMGNNGSSELSYPAAYPTVVGVGGVDSAGAMYSGSQHNETTWITAPGVGVASLGNVASAPDPSQGRYYLFNGTSLATPHVAAFGALAKDLDPEITPEEFRIVLKETAVDAGAPGWDEYYGYGILDIQAGLEYIETNFEHSLASLGVSGGTLSPSFDPEVTSYLIEAENKNDITLTPNAKQAGSTVKTNGTAYTDSPYAVTPSASGTVAEIAVTSPSGTRTTTYTVTVKRAPITYGYISTPSARITLTDGTFAVSDQNGYFEFPNLAANSYTATITKDSYLPRVITFNVAGNDDFVIAEQQSPLTLYGGDFNGDLRVNPSDYLIFMSCYNSADGNSSYNLHADFNSDGIIDSYDYSIFMSFYNKTVLSY